MTETSAQDQLTKYLTDVHSIEEQAIAQLEVAPRLARERGLADAFRQHLQETREQERLVREQLERRGAAPSKVKDVVGKLGGWGMVVFARLNPDTPGKLAMHAYSYEHMELAAYELLRRIADRAGDTGVAEMASTIAPQERAMADRIGEHWDGAVEASLRAKDAADLGEERIKYLRDAHALEAQALALLETGPMIAGFDTLATVFGEHLEETREHQRLIEARLSELDAKPSRFQSGAMRLGALNLGGFFKAQPDTPAKLAGFAYAFEALECGAYELLARTARRAGDEQTAALAERIRDEERVAGEKVAATWDEAAEVALREQGVATT